MDTLLNDRYLILKSLGKGGFSETFLAQDTLADELRVVKRLKLLSTSPEAVQGLFNNEVQTLYKLGNLSQQVPSLFDHFVEEESIYLIQEFIEGHPLSQEIKEGQKWSQTQIIELLRELLTSLQFLHSHQVIHGDIKPRNIMRRENGQLVLIDFGAVKLASDQSAQSVVVGTAGYMPNEQQAGRSRFSSDLYALGMVAIQCMTQIHPRKLEEDSQTGEIQWKKYTHLHPQLTEIIEKLVRVCLRDRYASAKEVLSDLNRFEQGFNQSQVKSQILYESMICLVLVGGLLWGGRTLIPRSFFRSPIALQVISLSVPLTTVKTLIKLRLW
jgi:serine/threonine protein kinase